MFIDEKFFEIVESLGHNNKQRRADYMNSLDGVTAVSINMLHKDKIDMTNADAMKVSFPETNIWFEAEKEDYYKFGVLVTYVEITLGQKKKVLSVLKKLIKKIKYRKKYGLFTSSKLNFMGVIALENFEVVMNTSNNKVYHIGSINRTVTDKGIRRDTILTSHYEQCNTDIISTILTNVLEAQYYRNNISKLKRIHSNETAHLHTPNYNADIDFEYKIVNVNPVTKEVTIRRPNPKGGGWKLHRHKKSGYTCKRRYHTKNGIITKTVKIPDYWAGHSEKTIHKDYKL